MGLCVFGVHMHGMCACGVCVEGGGGQSNDQLQLLAVNNYINYF